METLDDGVTSDQNQSSFCQNYVENLPVRSVEISTASVVPASCIAPSALVLLDHVLPKKNLFKTWFVPVAAVGPSFYSKIIG